MPGTKAGAAKAKVKRLAQDPDCYKKMGSAGGKKSSGYAFGHGKVDPSIIGRKGGSAPRRRKVTK